MAPNVDVWVRACTCMCLRACAFMSALAWAFVCVFGGCVVSVPVCIAVRTCVNFVSNVFFSKLVASKHNALS